MPGLLASIKGALPISQSPSALEHRPSALDDTTAPSSGLGPGPASAAPRPLEPDVAFAVALAAHQAAQGDQIWLSSVCTHLKEELLDGAEGTLSLESLKKSIPLEAHAPIAHSLLTASIFPPSSAASASPSSSSSTQKTAEYTPRARAHLFRTLPLLGIPREALFSAEAQVAAEAFTLLQDAEKAAGKGRGAEVERARKEREEGWGGNLGRWAATGAGVVLGSVALGVTGGLAAPAILSLLPLSGILAPAAAPVVLGTVFGVAGGGLAGRRVRARWAGVREFEFVQVVGAQPVSGPAAVPLDQEGEDGPGAGEQGSKEEDGKAKQDGTAAVPYAVRKARMPRPSADAPPASPLEDDLDGKLSDLKLDHAPVSSSSATAALPTKAPSLTVIVALTGLVTTSQDEGLLAFQRAALAPRIAPPPPPPTAAAPPTDSVSDPASPSSSPLFSEEGGNDSTAQVERALAVPSLPPAQPTTLPDAATLFRGRDLFVVRVETANMLSTGRSLNEWITDKLIKKATSEVLKRTFVNAYLAAVALPLTVYGWAGTVTDNLWIRSVDKARKAGQLLADVLLSRTHGSRPLTLVATSLGSLTAFHCLLSLASSPLPHARTLIDSCVLISLPSAPSPSQWAAARMASGRRLVNAYAGGDMVLASVVRLHEVVSGAVGEARLDGGKVAGLGPVAVEGVEDVDVGSVLQGHFAINANLPDILRLIDIDA